MADDRTPRDQEGTLAWDPDDIPEFRKDPEDAPEAPPEGEVTDDPAEDPLIGTLMRGKWRVLKRLGAGSFGTVYKVQDEKGGWIEALKILAVDRITGSEAAVARERFLREAQIMKRLGTQSQHIVGLSTYEEDLEAGLVYFLMEFVEGRPLSDVLGKDGPFSVERTIRLALQVCEALTVAHEGPEPVVHRDLKLENLMRTVDRSGEEVIKVLDFGIAKLAEKDADSKLTTVGTLGTPGYAAPEQLRGEGVDARTDLFAFGVILYALLTGKDPWLGHDASKSTTQIYELMVASDRGDVRPFEDTGVDVPPAMQNVVLRLLQRDARDRFQSARELREALERVLAGAGDADAASLRVLTETPGVKVQIRSGRKVVAEGPTPLSANGVHAGAYRVAVVDDRFEPLETSVSLAPGAMEDMELVPRPRATGAAAAAKRNLGVVAAAVVAVLLVAGAAVLQPWGRTLSADALLERARSGKVSSVWLSDAGVQGQGSVGPLPAPFRVEAPRAELPGLVGELRAAGVAVDTRWEVRRLLDEVARAQASARYFGAEGSDVLSLARSLARLEPESPEAASLFLKVAERMAWDAEAALARGEVPAARDLAQRCLDVVPGHAGCSAALEATQ